MTAMSGGAQGGSVYACVHVVFRLDFYLESQENCTKIVV